MEGRDRTHPAFAIAHPAMIPSYSDRSAVVGFRRVARHAGM